MIVIADPIYKSLWIMNADLIVPGKERIGCSLETKQIMNQSNAKTKILCCGKEEKSSKKHCVQLVYTRTPITVYFICWDKLQRVF